MHMFPKGWMALALCITSLLTANIASAQEQNKRDSTLALPQKWSTYYVVLLEKGPNYMANPTADSLKKLMNRHIQYQLQLQKKGQALVAGGFGPPANRSVGMTLLDVASLEAAGRLAHADPAVKAGWYKVIIYPWYVPAGRLE